MRLTQKVCLSGERLAAQGEDLRAILEFRATLKLWSEIQLPDSALGQLTPQPRWIADERRRHERFLLRMAVDVREGPYAYFPAHTLNVSAGGLEIESPREFSVGSQVEVITPMLEQSRKIVVPARIVRLDHQNAGVYCRLGLKLLSGEADTEEWQNLLVSG